MVAMALDNFRIVRNHFDDWSEIFKCYRLKKDLPGTCQIN
ncbi:hypothetical protein SFMTTN_2829 [Sulfuriferula multivorans]|uniref:Uncharacterized protein n=1 Tax=Sulfuriferula multivorans TaxID=1559896 RepID=A0A401JYN6_9PROT|nr:hypothetical protein SFMTTN_2829 [Sulfuriferula multivorans]